MCPAAGRHDVREVQVKGVDTTIRTDVRTPTDNPEAHRSRCRHPRRSLGAATVAIVPGASGRLCVRGARAWGLLCPSAAPPGRTARVAASSGDKCLDDLIMNLPDPLRAVDLIQLAVCRVVFQDGRHLLIEDR
jgi:hypothetical protein